MNEVADVLTGNSMSAIEWILTTWAVLSCLAWGLSYLKAVHGVRSIRLLKQLQPQSPQTFPRLSIIIPACNEGDTLGQALTTLLKQDYPNLEIILINDRSTDNTGDIVDQLASQDDRIVPVHITHLPPAWLGKVHALHLGSQRATGDWLLFTDADVHFQPGVLKKTIALCLEEQLDHLSVAAEAYSQSFWLDVTLAAFGLLFLNSINASEIGKPESDSFAGNGAFNLVRKSVFDRTAGFAWLRMEVVDDLGLALMMQQAGAWNCLVFGTDEIGLTWYPSLSTMVRGLEKNLFGAAAHYRYSSLFITVVLLWLLNLGWVVAILQQPGSWLWGFGIAAYGCLLLYAWAVWAKLRRFTFGMLLIPVGQLILSVILLRSAFSCWQQQGIVWRGTLYPLQQLKDGQRVKI